MDGDRKEIIIIRGAAPLELLHQGVHLAEVHLVQGLVPADGQVEAEQVSHCPLSRALFRCLSALAPCALLPCVLGSLSLLRMLSALGAVARSGSSGRPLPGAYPGTHAPPDITTLVSYNGAPNPAGLEA